MTRIVCFGSMNIDIAAYGSVLPRPGETVFGSALSTSPGGKGLNQAVAARRLGAAVAMVGCLGRDQQGQDIADFLAGEGIDTAGVVRLQDAQSGAAVILVDAHSQNAIVVIPGANMAWPPLHVDTMHLDRRDIVMSQFEIPDAVIATAFAQARAVGARTILNAAPARAIPPALMDLVDILVVNEVELAAACAAPFDPDDVAAVTRAALQLTRSNRAVVATLGARGAVVAAGGRITRIEGKAVPAIDTAGAGDCFIGALAAALARGEELEAAAVFANRAASLSVTRRGTAVAMPYAREL